MEQHQRQHDRAHGVRREDHLRHRHARREALLRAAENDGDLVRAREAQLFAREHRDAERQREQHRVHHHEPAERGERRVVPEPFVDGFRERAEHHQQDRALIDEFEHAAIALDPASDDGAQQLARDERHEQLQHDVPDRVPCRGAAGRLIGDDEAHQRGRDEDADQARRRRAAHGRRHVAARDRGERDRRLHGGGQRAEEQHAHIERGRDERREQRLEREAEHGEQHEGARQHDEVQTPVRGARDDRLARELGAVQEEQQADGDVGEPVERHGGRAVHGQQAGEDHGADEAQREVIGQEFRTSHYTISGARSSASPCAVRWAHNGSSGTLLSAQGH
ncbi:hypothetical protein PT2222_10293 [Paraburkholderia tropica]